MLVLFAGKEYYPEGGAKDLVGVFEDFDSLYRALNDLSDEEYDWANAVDVDGRRMVRHWVPHHGRVWASEVVDPNAPAWCME